MAIQNDPIYGLPFLYINGLTISVATDETLSISSGQCRDSNDVMDIVIGGDPLNGQATTAPVTLNYAVTGVNGLDTGTIAASKVYAVYAIGDSRYYQAPATIMTLASNSAPLMPFGYDSYRLIGYAVTDSSSDFLPAYISGNNNYRLFTYDVPAATAITAGNATSYTAVVLTTLVPPVDNTPVNIFTALTPAAAGNAVFLQGFDSTGDQVVNKGQVTAVVLNSYNTVLAQLDTAAPSIKYKVSAGGDAVAISVAGFVYFV